MVLNTIEEAKEGSAKTSAHNYIRALETSVVSGMLKGNSMKPGLYILDSSGDITSPVTLEVSLKGTKADEGNVCISDDGVVSAYSLKIGNYYVTSIDGTKQEITDKLVEISCDDSVNNLSSICKPVNVKVEGQYNYGDEYLCDPGDGVKRTFYLLEDGDNTALTKGTTGTASVGEVSLLMNQNIDDTTVAWISLEDYNNANTDGTACNYDACNDEGPVTALRYLTTKTSSWKNISVNLPTYDQIRQISQNSIFVGYTWLYDYLDGTTNSVNGIDGYWLNSTYDYQMGTTGAEDTVLLIDCDGTIDYDDVRNNTMIGVRPVITVSKS